ncbi:MAG: C39 family peptidase [Candidatus Doudnabacteria bacterium]|nr:C39 family peptidase [Candidatus Doudnabacteria bacterium]
MTMRPRIYVIALVVAGFVGATLLSDRDFRNGNLILAPQETPVFGQNEKPEKEILEDEIPVEPKILPMRVLHEVPFTSQAPFANWHDSRYQNACEEAAVLMAARWVAGRSLSADSANEEIADLVVFENSRYGFSVDSSAEDTARLFREYYKLGSVLLSRNVSVESIKQELAAENLVIVPAHGRSLGNPYYTQPGPERHMLVITGYDDERQVFITNDPGTRRGEDFVYSYATLLNAVRDYPSGDHAPITAVEKAMIVVGRN